MKQVHIDVIKGIINPADIQNRSISGEKVRGLRNSSEEQSADEGQSEV